MTDEQLESIQGDVYLWAIGEIDSYDAMSSICETLGIPHPDEEQTREENRRLRERVLLLAKAFSLVSAGLPLDQLQTEEHV